MNNLNAPRTVPPPLPQMPPPIPQRPPPIPPPLPGNQAGGTFDETVAVGRKLAGALGAAGQNLFKEIRSTVKEQICDGKTGVFMNGRELGFWELTRMRSYVALQRGRYW